MEKDFLQSLKLEISKNFTLTAYERVAFHKILGLFRSENGQKVLLRDLKKDGVLRASAIDVLTNFESDDVTDAFVELLSSGKNLTREEFLNIVGHIEKFGKEKHCDILIDYISQYIDKTDYMENICKAAFALGQIAGQNQRAGEYISGIISNTEMFEKLRSAAIETAVSTDDISRLEAVLRENNDRLNYAVYRALASLADREMAKYEENMSDDLFTVMPGQDDRMLLDIRVLLGKMSPMFDSYSRETKAAYIMAMIMCGHREFIVYTMKALTSNDPALIDVTLYVILSYSQKLRTPDKLFRSLVSLPSVTARDSGIIIDIFVKYFTGMRETKTNLLFKDKIYNYIVVTLDSYFETYRKNFMIPEIMEKNHTQEVQGIRRFIINRFSPEIKRKVINHLLNEDITLIKKILGEISESVSYIPDDEKDQFSQFIELLYEKEQKTREISASRIEDIDYEKRYLRNRIVRLCSIIGRLRISEAASNLVKIFNYVKKYNDEEIYEAVTYTLSLLNYPYMLGELEVLLLSGDETEQLKSTRLLALFSDQRSLNIMLDYLNDRAAESSPVLEEIASILVRRDVHNNVSAREIAKKVIADNQNPNIRRLAVHLLGQCGYEEDFDYLMGLFQSLNENTVKEAVVQSFDFIIRISKEFNKPLVVNLLKEFLKDPGIKVRMYACAILLRLGNQDALGTIRDMMVIKNRNIQREIIMVLGNFITADLAFFYISLLKEDYAISQDIIPLFHYLPQSDLKEVDHFVVNLFKKFEGGGYEYGGASHSSESMEFKNHKREDTAVLFIEIIDFDRLFEVFSAVEISMVFRRVFSQIIEVITNNSGTITRTAAGEIIAYFPEVVSAARSAGEISRKVDDFNIWIHPDNQIKLVTYLMLSETDIVNGEIIMPLMREFNVLRAANINRKVFLSGTVARIAELAFKCDTLPAALFSMNGSALEYKELISPNNFSTVADIVVDHLRAEEAEKIEAQKQLEQGLKTAGSEKMSKNTIAFANAMERIGKVLRKDLSDVSKYVAKRSTDKDLVKNVERMLNDAYRQYMLESSKTVIE